jgi:nitrous oxidase accessory protein
MRPEDRLFAFRLSCAASLCLALSGFCAAAEVRAGGDSTYRTIREALRAAQAGDTVIVSPGEYRESLVIDKPVILAGDAMPHIRGSNDGDVVVIQADDVTLRGFKISGSGDRMMASDAGVKIVGSRATVQANQLFDNLFGIYLKGCTKAVVERNRIEGRAAVDIGRRGAGIHFYDARDNVIRGNKVSFVRDGVYFDHSDNNTVERNEFSHLRYGVHYMYCSDNRFLQNLFRDSIGGVAIMYTERVTFRDNQILNNRQGYNAFGLLLKDCLDSVAERNVIINNVNGIFLDSSHRNQFRRNLIAYNDVGVLLYASSLNNVFSENDFIGNQAVLHTVGRADARWESGGHGNYYSRYFGPDLDGNGIGDTPYRIQDAFEYLEGNRPILGLFLNSAAADALAAAERVLPLVPSSHEVDNAPMMRPVSGVRAHYAPVNGVASGVAGLSVGLALLCFTAGAWLSRRLRA